MEYSLSLSYSSLHDDCYHASAYEKLDPRIQYPNCGHHFNHELVGHELQGQPKDLESCNTSSQGQNPCLDGLGFGHSDHMDSDPPTNANIQYQQLQVKFCHSNHPKQHRTPCYAPNMIDIQFQSAIQLQLCNLTISPGSAHQASVFPWCIPPHAPTLVSEFCTS
jgi:hypothetical protein